MTRIIWITGRAASGKSTVIRAIEAQLRERAVIVNLLCDEDILFDLKSADVGHQHHWHPDGDPNHFHLRSGRLFDEGIRMISRRLVDLIDRSGDPVALVELARGGAEPIDVSYRRALELIDPRVWVHSMVFRLDLPFAMQTMRNQRRAALGGRTTLAETLEALYRADDPESFVGAGIPVTNLKAAADPHTNAVRVLSAAHLDG